MEIKIFVSYDALSQETATQVINLVKQKPDAVICVASGNTPIRTCEWIVKLAAEEKVDFSHCCFIGLDEWVGIAPENKGSCHYFQQHYLFQPLGLTTAQTFLFDALAIDMHQQCLNMDKVIAAKGGIDLMIVGIGMNGHIGFNEPGVDVKLLSHVIELQETTQTVGQKYFTDATVLTQGITLGLGHLMQAKKTILIANGISKATVIRQTVKEPVTAAMPSSILQSHPNSFVYIDEAAASLL